MDGFGPARWVQEDTSIGYQKLQELRLLKAAAARLMGQQPADAGGAHSTTSSSASSTSCTLPLLRSFSNIEPTTAQRLSRTSSMSAERPSVVPSRLGRSNSAGSHRLACYLPPPSPHQAASTRGPPAAAAAAATFPAAVQATAGAGTVRVAGQQQQQQQPWPRGPRHSEPAGGMGLDARVNLLLAEVESLLSERQQLTARCCVLQKDNDQLAELVGRLTRTVQEQESQLQQLQHLEQLQQSAGFLHGSVASLSLHSPATLTAGGQHQHHQQHQQHQVQQRRVDEWLGRRQETLQEWVSWQGRVPLEHMHSGSSSTLTVSLDQQ